MMESLGVVGFVLCVALALKAMTQEGFIQRFSQRQKLGLVAAGVLLPLVFFAPLIFAWPTSRYPIPGWLSWGPMLGLGAVGYAAQIFWPEKVKQYDKPVAIAVFTLLAVLNLLPFLLGFAERWGFF